MPIDRQSRDSGIAYLSLGQVLEVHELMIQRFGGLRGVRDKNLLLSSLEAPKISFEGKELYPSIFDKAACYLYSFARNHPFSDGNKRTAYFITLLFLQANRIQLFFQKEDLEELVVLAAQGKASKEEASCFLETGIFPLRSGY